MYLILIPILIISFVTGFLLFNIDKELKYLNKLNIKKSKLVKLNKSKKLFYYENKTDGIITTFVLVNSIIYYVANITGLVLLIIHFISKNKLLYIISCSLFFVNIFIIVRLSLKISLNNEQRKIKLKDQKIKN